MPAGWRAQLPAEERDLRCCGRACGKAYLRCNCSFKGASQRGGAEVTATFDENEARIVIGKTQPRALFMVRVLGGSGQRGLRAVVRFMP